MYVMISYDVKSDKRRNTIHKVLKNYGEWMQYSIFECQIDEQQYRELRSRLKHVINKEDDDSLRVYHICADCRPKIEHIGGHSAREDGPMFL